MDLQQLAYDEDFDGVIASASSLGDKLLNNLPSVAAASIDQILKEGLADMDRRAASKNKDIYVEAGIRAIDRLIGGFDAGSLIIIGGVTSMGKTAFALQFAYNMSVFHPVMFFSLEMTKVEIMNRYIVAQTDIDPVRIKRPEMLTQQEWQLIEKANGEIRTHNLTVEDSTRLTIYNLRAKIYRVVRSKGVKAVFIDYLQLMGGKKGADMAEYYGSISRTCKEIAKELKIRIFLLSQLNREAAKREDKIPRLHDLRSSGEIEQDADIVIFPVRCDRAGIDGPAPAGPGKAIISIPKNRNGETDNVVINVSKNAARWWGDDEFYGPTTPVAPHYLDDKEEPKF
jgi:replicative DNA helicase